MRLPTRPASVGGNQLEADARGSFGQKKANQHWRWLAMDAITRPMIALPVDERSQARAKALWATIPAV